MSHASEAGSGSAEEPAPDDPVMRRVRLEEEWLAHFEGGETPATGTPEIDFGRLPGYQRGDGTNCRR
jgi:hypothetical protein